MIAGNVLGQFETMGGFHVGMTSHTAEAKCSMSLRVITYPFLTSCKCGEAITGINNPFRAIGWV
jgi:hypothetical protein